MLAVKSICVNEGPLLRLLSPQPITIALSFQSLLQVERPYAVLLYSKVTPSHHLLTGVWESILRLFQKRIKRETLFLVSATLVQENTDPADLPVSFEAKRSNVCSLFCHLVESVLRFW